jgi:hypothetical protein
MARLEEIRAAGASTVTVASKLPDSGLRLLVSGSSRVAADLALDRAEATVSGSSRLELTGTANALSAQGSGASTLDLADLRLRDLDIQLSGASHGSVNVTGTIAAQVSGASKLTYAGTPQFTKRDTSGAPASRPPNLPTTCGTQGSLATQQAPERQELFRPARCRCRASGHA